MMQRLIQYIHICIGIAAQGASHKDEQSIAHIGNAKNGMTLRNRRQRQSREPSLHGHMSVVSIDMDDDVEGIRWKSKFAGLFVSSYRLSWQSHLATHRRENDVPKNSQSQRRLLNFTSTSALARFCARNAKKIVMLCGISMFI